MIKRISAGILSAFVAVSSASAASAETDVPNAAAQEALVGDVDANGTIGISDATALQYFLVRDIPPSQEQSQVMDADGNGSVNINDATEIQRFAAEFPCSELIGKPCAEVYAEMEPTTLTLNTNALTLGTAEAVTLTAEADAPLKNTPQFFSDNPSVAEVTVDGVVTAKQAGTARVVCSAGTLSDVCTVTVLPLAQTLALNRLSLTLAPNETFAVEVHLPNGTAAHHRTFSSGNEAVASVDETGVITAKAPGTARIYCMIDSGARSYITVTVENPLRLQMVEHLRSQLGKDNRIYAEYINAHSDLNVSMYFAWCAVFAWSTLDRFAAEAGRENPIAPGKQVSDLAVQANKLGALHNILDNDYTPKPGDLFTTSTLTRPIDDGREHIGYIESVDLDANGKVLKVHTIEGNFGWETKYADETRVSRSEWVPGERNIYNAALVEYIDLETLLAKIL